MISFLKGRMQQIGVFGRGGTAFYSEIAEVVSGVPQGIVLRPTLLNIYISNTPKKNETNKLSPYPDDSETYWSH